MEEWFEFEIPDLGYILEFSMPQNDRMLVRTLNGMVAIDLDPDQVDHKIVMSADEVEVLDNGDSWGTEQSETLSFDDEEWFFLGSESTLEPRTQLSTGQHIEIANDRKHLLLINTVNEKVIQTIDFNPPSDADDFAIASFSQDEKYLVLCTSDQLKVFARDQLD